MTTPEAAAPSGIPFDTFGVRLRLARVHAGDISIEKAAELCGVKPATWSTWERGTRPRDMATVVQKISYGLAQDGVPLDAVWLMWGQSSEGGPGDTPGLQPSLAKVANSVRMGTRRTNASQRRLASGPVTTAA